MGIKMVCARNTALTLIWEVTLTEKKHLMDRRLYDCVRLRASSAVEAGAKALKKYRRVPNLVVTQVLLIVAVE
jgi:hypothetical protein